MAKDQSRLCDERTELLLAEPCFVIDPLPERVSAERGDQYSVIEPLLHNEELFHHFAQLLLKLNGYYDYAVYRQETWHKCPQPEDYTAWIKESFRTQERLVFLFEQPDAMITLDGDDTHMTVFHTDPILLKRVRELACTEGLFVWEGQ